jgi:hypothetical protein
LRPGSPRSREARERSGWRLVAASLVLAGRRRDGAGFVMRFLCADAYSWITGQVWALNGSRAM